MTNATKSAPSDTHDDLYERVLADWRQRLSDGYWLGKKALIQATSAALCDAFLKTSNSSAWGDLTNPHELAWARFERDVLPTLLQDDDYEERTHIRQVEIRCCQPSPVVKPVGTGDLNAQQQQMPKPVVSTVDAAADAVADLQVDENAGSSQVMVIDPKTPATAHEDKPTVAVMPVGPADMGVVQPPIGITLSINQIQVGQRHRKDLGDIAGLAASIEQVGLLQPIAIRPDHHLIAGQRRLEAIKSLGWTEVPVVIVSNLEDALPMLKAERDENQCRKDFQPSEAVALGKAIEAIEAPQAKQRQHGGRPKRTGGNLPPVTGIGKTRDKVAQVVGMSGRTYEKAKAVVAAAEADPELGDLVEQMDKSGKVDAAYQQVKGRNTSKSRTMKKAASKASHNGKPDTLIIAKPATVDGRKALAARLVEFLGRQVFEAVVNIALKVKQPAKKTVASTPAANLLRGRGKRAFHREEEQDSFKCAC
jgi:ParB-like chromosome segregation protein Spo0J